MLNKSLNKKVIIVTGASSGIGRAIALKLQLEGASVVAVARRKKLLDEVFEFPYKADLRDSKQITNLVNYVIKKFEKVDIIINVAAVGYYNWLENVSQEELQEQYQTNMIAPAELIRQVIPFMKAQKSGHIINITSYASRLAVPPQEIYASTKYALEGLSDGLRRQLSPWNIKVTRVHPWAVDTNFNKKAAKNNGIMFPSKIGVPFMKLTEVKPEFVANEIFEVIKNPKKAIYISKFKTLIDFIVLINYFFPGVVDFFYSFYVKQMIKMHPLKSN